MARKPPSMVLFPGGLGEARVRDENVGTRKPKKRTPRADTESILERFDKMATSHIQEHRRAGRPMRSLSDEDVLEEPKKLSATGGRRPLKSVSKTLASSMSNADIAEELNVQHDNELTEAIDKLIRAEEASRFTEMMIAAEAAVAAAPPEFAEEAALAVTRDYHTEKITPIKEEEVRGETLIEVVGYVAYTKRGSKEGKTRYCAC